MGIKVMPNTRCYWINDTMFQDTYLKSKILYLELTRYLHPIESLDISDKLRKVNCDKSYIILCNNIFLYYCDIYNTIYLLLDEI